MLMQGLLQVLQHFEHYSNIPQIKDMSSQLKQIQVKNKFYVLIHFFAKNSAFYVSIPKKQTPCLKP
jgi:hypothetical protein